MRYPRIDGVTGAKTLFGGMDENAFITGVERSAWLAFEMCGENGFFDSLKPPLIKHCSATLPQATIRRQGDIWSVALPHDFYRSLMDKAEVGNRRKFRRFFNGQTGQSAISVFGTNHILTGRAVEGISIRGFCTNGTLGTGVLTAPDHAPQELFDCMYAFARTTRLQPVTEEERSAGYE